MRFKKPLISIVTPIYNEEAGLAVYYEKMTRVLNELSSEYEFEIVLTDNRSEDRSFELIRELASKDSRIRAFRFSRNFGYQRSILTGYSMAKGQAAVEFDCDLQDPPELLHTFLKHWKSGFEIVYGVRTKRPEGFLITQLRKIFYRMLRRISRDDMPVDAGDFMLLDRKVLAHLTQIYDPHIYIRGAIFEMGFRKIGVPYERRARERGQSKFPFHRLIELAMDGIISQSTLPLRLASWFGVFIAALTVALGAVYVLLKLFSTVTMPAGFTTQVVLILFSIAVNAIFLGIIGEYLARIYLLLRGRPITIIDEAIDRQSKPPEPHLHPN